MKLKKEIFQRGVRMTHRFGENDDPLQSGEYFEAKTPMGIKAQNKNTHSFNVHQKGLYPYTLPLSPVEKFKGGTASICGPKLDNPDKFVERPPTSTGRRKVTAGAK